MAWTKSRLGRWAQGEGNRCFVVPSETLKGKTLRQVMDLMGDDYETFCRAWSASHDIPFTNVDADALAVSL